MNLLVVGALSWNPERLRSLADAGHRLWGLWSRSMAWDQGPYPVLDGIVRPVTMEEAPHVIRDERIDAVYCLFQVYHPSLWGPPAPGVEHDVWTILRRLLDERRRGAFDAPIVFHWGFDVQNLDPAVVRALDGHVLCNREKLAYWTTPVRDGGCGLDCFDRAPVTGFLDGDLPKREFMNERFAEPLSARGEERHTVCVGRPFRIDYLAAARRGIHVHLYGNSFDEVYRSMARDLSPRDAVRSADLLGRFVHVHPSLQTIGRGWDEVRRIKADWVHEFSRYDAGWSYVGLPLPWMPLDDRAVIPNRVSTYVLSGLPVIGDRRPGCYRWEEPRRLGIEVEHDAADYDRLRDALDREVATRAKQAAARAERFGYAFDATIPALTELLERARDAYFARPHGERVQFVPGDGRLVHFNTSPDPRARVASLVRRLARRPERSAPARVIGAVREVAGEARNALVPWRARRLAARLAPVLERRA